MQLEWTAELEAHAHKNWLNQAQFIAYFAFDLSPGKLYNLRQWGALDWLYAPRPENEKDDLFYDEDAVIRLMEDRDGRRTGRLPEKQFEHVVAIYRAAEVMEAQFGAKYLKATRENYGHVLAHRNNRMRPAKYYGEQLPKSAYDTQMILNLAKRILSFNPVHWRTGREHGRIDLMRWKLRAAPGLHFSGNEPLFLRELAEDARDWASDAFLVASRLDSLAKEIEHDRANP